MKILIADDDPVSLHLLERSLANWNYEVVCAVDGNSAWEVMQGEDAPRLAVLDWIMPDPDGIEICRRLRQNQLTAEDYTYIIILTQKSSLTDIVAGLRAGADDYIIKPFIPQDLQVRVEAGKRIVELQQRLLDAQQALTAQISHDIPTRTWNRDTILAHIRAELNRTRRKNGSASIAVLKVENFASLCSNAGDVLAEHALCEYLQCIRNAIRSYDSIGRFTEDEFLILFPETASQNMPTIISRLQKSLEERQVLLENVAETISLSIGVVTFQGAPHIDEVISAATESLQTARQQSDTRIHFSTLQRTG
ncbi:MAG: response regulator [Geobacter sp.]|nr:response regulator [Geobacter sp.]